MRIRSVPVPAVISHFFCFLLGTLLVLPWDSPCEMQLKGILFHPSSSLEKKLADVDERAALYVVTKQGYESCRVSDLPFYVWRDPAGQGVYVHMEKAVGAVKILESMLSRKGFEVTSSGLHYPACDVAEQVVYGS
ncbi:MAG: hypothetical protein ACOH5I_01500 [Oligoflexus sp.]